MCVNGKEGVDLMKKKISPENDNRKVVIYARKSKVTHKGDSIANQEEYCKDYARLHLNLPVDYEYDIYEDEGKSGFYADRPDFQRMIHDVERRKIKAIVCYKLDRISRKMSDLTNMIDFLNKYNVALLISSNNLNTKDNNSKMMIHLLGMIAEFERDIITERIQDNLGELAKDGRWMGGITPTGFTTEKSKTGRGKSKNVFTYLVPIPEERLLIEHLFELFLKTRSYNQTAKQLNDEGFKTKKNAKFTILAVKDLISNPVYCIADEYSYQYFLDEGCNLYGDKEEYDGFHGISVYNRTTQTREESNESTFLNPEFSRYTIRKEKEEWIIAVGRHEGFICSKDWVAAQRLKDEIADKYNRPHRATNALLSGIVYCPLCGNRLVVIPESNRYTNGKPRFKYACSNSVRKGKCSFQAIRGVELDEYVVGELSKLREDNNQYIKKIKADVMALVASQKNEQDAVSLKKDLNKLEQEIKIQVKSLRTANDVTKPYIQADIDDMAQEVTEKKKKLQKLDNLEKEKNDQVVNLSEILNLAISFENLADSEEPATIISAIRTIVERIVVTQDGEESRVNIYLKGEMGENYEEFFESGDASEMAESNMCDSDRCRELHSYLRRSTAAGGVQPKD